jgi:hypothetical protein
MPTAPKSVPGKTGHTPAALGPEGADTVLLAIPAELDLDAILDTMLATGATPEDTALALLGGLGCKITGDYGWVEGVMSQPALARDVGEGLLARAQGREAAAIGVALDIGLALPDASWIRPALVGAGLWNQVALSDGRYHPILVDAGAGSGWRFERSILGRTILDGWRQVVDRAFALSRGHEGAAIGRKEAAESLLCGLRYAGLAAKATPDPELPDLRAWLGRRGVDPLCAALAGARMTGLMDPTLATALALRLGADPWWADRITTEGVALAGADLETVPEGFRVFPGTFDAYGCPNLKRLPDGMVVDGNLALEGCARLEALPANLWVEWALILDGCAALKALPHGLQGAGQGNGIGLSMKGCPPLPLPEDAFVAEDFIVTDAFPDGTDVRAYRAWTRDEGL